MKVEKGFNFNDLKVFNSEFVYERDSYTLVFCLENYVQKTITLIFHKEEKPFWVLAENLNCFLRHLCEGGVHGWITIQLVAAVFGLKET